MNRIVNKFCNSPVLRQHKVDIVSILSTREVSTEKPGGCSVSRRKKGWPTRDRWRIHSFIFNHILDWTWALLLSKHVLGPKQTDLDDAQAGNREEILSVPS